MIFVKGKPRGKGRPRFTARGHIYTDPITRSYENQIAAEYKAQGGEYLGESAIKIFIEARYKIPASKSKKTRWAMFKDKLFPKKKPDIDNVIKAVFDGLNGVAWKDDKQVVELYARKVYSENEGVLFAAEVKDESTV